MNKVLPLIPGKIYHIYNRGNNGDNIFLEDKNYSYFLGLCEKYLLPVIDILTFCLLRNHFHLLVRVKTEYETIAISDLQGFKNLEGVDPTNQFSKFFNAYAKVINKQL